MDKRSKKIQILRYFLCCWIVFILLLTGCNPESGATTYEVIYPSGYTRDYNVYEQETPIEGTSYYLQWEEAEDYKQTYNYDLNILNENGFLLYKYPNIGRKTMRGILQENDIVWICVEYWTSPLRIGYVEGWLEENHVLLIDMHDGKILFQEQTGEREFYLTSSDTRCYFYDPGEEERTVFMGFIRIPPKYAEIYYRDMSNWAQKQTVYTFDYAVEPNIDTSSGVETRIKFYLLKDQIQVSWISYESIGDEKWEYIDKKSYNIPYDVSSSKLP